MVWLGPILESPSAERSKHPIWKLLRNKVFTDPHQRYEVLEIAAGSGIHMEYIIQRLDRMHRGGIQWYPTDTDPAALASLEARRQEEHMAALLQDTIVGAPLPLTLIESGIQEETTRSILPSKFDVIININMIHISPWTATMGLVKVASQFLRPGGVLYLFGPFKVNGMSAPLNRYVSFFFFFLKYPSRSPVSWKFATISAGTYLSIPLTQPISFLLGFALLDWMAYFLLVGSPHTQKNLALFGAGCYAIAKVNLISYYNQRIPLSVYGIWKMS